MIGGRAAEAGLKGSRPNIVFILTDDQGYGELSCHGNSILKTPHLDALYRQSLRFTNFHVSPTCAPTRAALMTGRHEFRSGITHTILERERLDLNALTLAELVRRAGYATGIFGKWHLGDEDEYLPNRRGFDETFIHGGGGIGQTYPGSCGDAPNNEYFDPWIWHNDRFEKTHGYCTDVFFQEAAEWIEKQKGKRPFLAWISPNVPHAPLTTPGEDWEAPYRNRGLDEYGVKYYAMIADLDAAIGKLLQRLDDLELAKETLVIFVTDNGHSVRSVYNAGMRAAKGSPYEGGTRVPSFWRWPGHISAGVDSAALTAHVDLLPTLAGLVGQPAPDKLDGRSLVPLLENPEAAWPDRLLFTHVGRWETGQAAAAKYRGCAVRDARFKLVNNTELYDLKNDPGESRNVIQEHPDEVRKLREAYEDWWKDVLPATVANEQARGPKINPFKQRFWQQYGRAEKAEAWEWKMNPDLKFDPKRPPL